MMKNFGRYFMNACGVLIVLAFALWLSFGFIINAYTDKKIRKAYGREAVSALALDAALTFPPTKTPTSSYWRSENTPCIFTTNVRIPSGNSGSRVTWENWPEGAQPSCGDFFASDKRDFDPRTTIPGNCYPVQAWSNKGGAKNSFLVLAADGAPTENLQHMMLPELNRERIRKWDKISGFYYTNLFVEAGGFEGVNLVLDERSQCDGFSLFRYQTEIKDLDRLRVKLELAGYFVGLK